MQRDLGSHGPGDVGRVLLRLHAQHGDAGRAPLELGLGLEGVVAVGGRREQGVGAEEVVEGHVPKLVLLVGEAHVAVVSGAGGRARGVGGDAGGGAPGQHAGGHHRASRGRAGPQVVGDLRVRGRKTRGHSMRNSCTIQTMLDSMYGGGGSPSPEPPPGVLLLFYYTQNGCFIAHVGKSVIVPHLQPTAR